MALVLGGDKAHRLLILLREEGCAPDVSPVTVSRIVKVAVQHLNQQPPPHVLSGKCVVS